MRLTPGSYHRITGQLFQAQFVRRERPNGIHGIPNLTMHRSVQEVIIHKLNRDIPLRDKSFSIVVDLLRQALPKPNLLQQPDPENWPLIEKQLPQLASLASAYKRTDPRIKASLGLAELFSDVGFNVSERGMSGDGQRILETAETVLDEMQFDPDSPLRANIHLILALILDNVGITQRRQTLERRQAAFNIRTKMLNAIEPAKRTTEDEILYYNALNDLSCSYQDYNRFDEIEVNSTACLKKYQEWGDERKVPFEYGKYHHQMALVYAGRGQTKRAVVSARLATQLMAEAFPAGGIVLKYRFDCANIIFQDGNLEEAIKEHKAILVLRRHSGGNASFLTLQSFLALGILYLYQKDYGAAE